MCATALGSLERGRGVVKQIEGRFPFLPAGCSMHWIGSPRSTSSATSGTDLFELDASFIEKRCPVHVVSDSPQIVEGRRANFPVLPALPGEEREGRPFARLLHVDDELRLERWLDWLSNDTPAARHRWIRRRVDLR